jgi:transcriptional regulator with GAF, ATPase, and Fis domain
MAHVALSPYDEVLHAAHVDHLEERLVQIALGLTSALSASMYQRDNPLDALALTSHVCDGVVMSRPGRLLRRRRAGRPNGIAFQVVDSGEPYLCNDTSRDPHYAPFLQDLGSVLGVPLIYQGKPIGALLVGCHRTNAFHARHVRELTTLASSAVKFLRRAELYRRSRGRSRRPFLIKGLSPEWLEVEHQMEQAANTEVPILLLGESGTGKELVANAVHFNSRRSDKPFVAVNCAAIPETLLESTLFGHVRGAFTGAVANKVGEFQKASGGTLFLDEVGELPLSLQAKVLRAIEDGEVQPIGSSKSPDRVDVRLVCATNRDLPSLARQRAFREDLLHRISVVTLELPPLRTFKDNLPVLAKVALQQAAETHGKSVTRIEPEAMQALMSYDYPGNLRELRNLLERAVILAEGDSVDCEHFPRNVVSCQPARAVPPPDPVSGRKSLRAMREEWLAPLERAYVSQVLGECDGNVRAAARVCEVDPVTFYRLLKKRGIKLERVVGQGS